jgi:hypothetical protein
MFAKEVMNMEKQVTPNSYTVEMNFIFFVTSNLGEMLEKILK